MPARLHAVSKNLRINAQSIGGAMSGNGDTQQQKPDVFELTPYEGEPDAGQIDLFGPVPEALSLDEVRKGIRGVSRPRDLRPLVQKSTHDPLMNMLELAMKAKDAGKDDLAFTRFAEVLPYIWTKVSGNGIAAMLEGAGQQGG